MAYRGRGRGRGYGRGNVPYAKQEPVILFPDVELPDIKGVPEEKALVIWNTRLQNYWKSSPYFLEEAVSKKSQSIDVERFSDLEKPKNTSRHNNLNQFLQLQSNNFPKELIGGTMMMHRKRRKVQWNLESDLQKLDIIAQQELQGGGKEMKDGGADDDEDDVGDDELAEQEGELSDDGDYNQNRDFDDDEDDYNNYDDNEDELTYD